MNIRYFTIHFRNKIQKGFTLIEVLVAVLLLSIGLFGMMGMQIRGVVANQSALQRSQAVMLSYSFLESVRANLSAAQNGDYVLSRTCAVPDKVTTVVDYDKKRLLQTAKQALGDLVTTCAEITFSSGVYSLTLEWDDDRGLTHQKFTSTGRP